MKVSATQLRKDIYNILDQVLKTGMPVEIERDHKILKIVAPRDAGRLAKLKPMPNLIIQGDIDSLEDIDCSKEWKP